MLSTSSEYLNFSIPEERSHQHSLTPRLQLTRYCEPYLSIATTLLGFPLVELDLSIRNDFLQGMEADSYWFYSGFPCLNTICLRFYDLQARSQDTASRILYTFLKSSPRVQTLSLFVHERFGDWGPTGRSVQSLLELAITGKNRLPRGAPRLRKITIKGTGYTTTPELASALNTPALKELFLIAENPLFLSMANEGFWLALAKRSSDPVKLTTLRCPRLTPGLIDFLRSFSGLERLEFDTTFQAEVPSNPRPFALQEARETRRELPDAFFDEALPSHKTSLKYLSFCGNVETGELWEVQPEYLERICQCSSLREVRIPIRYPGPDLVCFALISLSAHII